MALEGGDGGRLGRGEGIRANSLGRTKEGIRGGDFYLEYPRALF